MAKVLGSRGTPLVYNLKSVSQASTSSPRTFFPNIWAGIKKSVPASRADLTQEQLSTITQYINGLKENSKEVNDSNKGMRVPPQFSVVIDKLDMWDDEKAKIE